jgi:hypothetical protein
MTEVLETLGDLPPGLADQLLKLLEQKDIDRAQAMVELFEGFAGD